MYLKKYSETHEHATACLTSVPKRVRHLRQFVNARKHCFSHIDFPISRNLVGEQTSKAKKKRMSESPAMSVREVADFLRATRSAVFGLVHSGELSYQKIGRRFVIERASVEDFLARGWQRSTSQEPQK